MKKLTIDTGIQEFMVNGGEENGGGILRFNPSDPNVYNRFFGAQATLVEMDEQAAAQCAALDAKQLDDTAKAGELLHILHEYDNKMKGLLYKIFGCENDFDAILGGVNLAAVAGNGERVVTNLMNALAPIIRDGAEKGMRVKASDAVTAANLNREQRRAAAKNGSNEA